MNTTLTQAPTRPRVTKSFVDQHGVTRMRGSVEDIASLQSRTISAILDVNNIERKPDMHRLVSEVCHLYESAAYLQADYRIGLALKKEPGLRPYFYYYKRICERVLATPLNAQEKAYEARCIRRNRLPRRLRWLRPGEVMGRCKWCARYTDWFDPGHAMYDSNRCRHCKRMYPMPSVVWDSPEGRAYCYYRGSHEDRAFYQEFERDYAADPR